MMRLAILSGLLLASVGGSGAYFITSVDKAHEVPFSTRYTSLLAKEPETVYRHLDEAVQTCAPQTVKIAGEQRRGLIEGFALAVQMKSEGRSTGDFDRDITTLLDEKTQTCILSEAKRGLTLHIAVASSAWNLRR